MTIQTYRGKELSVSVGYRIPLDAYQEAERRARLAGVRLSTILRTATLAGLAVLAGDGDQEPQSQDGPQSQGVYQ